MGRRTYERHAADILCPFFVGKERNKIVCEGLIDGSTTSMAFKNSAVCFAWQEDYCAGSYGSCGIASMLEAKWAKQ